MEKKSFYDEIKSNIIEKNIRDDNIVRNFLLTKRIETKSNYDSILDIKNYIISENKIEEIFKNSIEILEIVRKLIISHI